MDNYRVCFKIEFAVEIKTLLKTSVK